jgi:D-alanyl-D-alanine carboxypeptidase (penicillin-binding protein 5/6)
MEWGFREFDAYPFFKGGETVEAAPVWMGTADTVPATVPKDLIVTMSREERRQMKVTAKFDKPVEAPVAKGDPVGRLVIEAPGFSTREVPLVAGQDVPALGFMGRVFAAGRHLISGTAN